MVHVTQTRDGESLHRYNEKFKLTATDQVWNSCRMDCMLTFEEILKFSNCKQKTRKKMSFIRDFPENSRVLISRCLPEPCLSTFSFWR